MAEEDDKPFSVKDRRRIRPDGEAQPEAGEEEASRGPPPSEADLPPLEFSTLLLSLASSVVLHLGELPHPETGRTEKNLPLAQQTIDLLAILQQKTRGNLTAEESGLLDSLLYELRMKYVQARR